MDVLFKTAHGSHLYGLSHAGSDEDFYVVVSKVKTNRAKYAKQTIVDNIDTTLVDFGTWLHQCEVGVPQALEAMFSDQPIVDNLEGFRQNYYVGTEVWSRYLRTIKSFALDDGETWKKKRHSLRLAINFAELRERGRFNPALSPEQRAYVSMFANMPGSYVYRMALDIAWQV